MLEPAIHLQPAIAGVGAGTLAVVLLEAAGALVLVALLGIATLRRRSRPYALLTISASTFVVAAIGGVLVTTGTVSVAQYIMLEHGLDLLCLGSAIAAIHTAREAGR